MTITTDYAAELAAWREKIEIPLRRDWVSLIGRFELQPGRSRIGAAPESDIVLPAGSAPEHVGHITFADGVVTLETAPGVALLVNGATPAGSAVLRSDADTKRTPDLVTVGSLTLFVIQRGPRTILRVRDAQSPALAAFTGRRWYPIDESFRVEGVFTPYDPPKSLAITNLLGDTSAPPSPGFVTFTLAGQEHRLDATGWRDGGLVLHFRDATSGNETYGGGRAVVTALPEGSLVVVDFNRASNLPCVFTEHATCPLPPEQNRLPVRVSAGELLPESAPAH
jgi:uncharacterized protein